MGGDLEIEMGRPQQLSESTKVAVLDYPRCSTNFGDVSSKSENTILTAKAPSANARNRVWFAEVDVEIPGYDDGTDAPSSP